ncbi:MAG TPA: leucyl aminopeptidase [Candidatus Lumbricidophila sp.]|nr:leucyl aminopeptidase [Candidatus Lumbricidophila sp.]
MNLPELVIISSSASSSEADVVVLAVTPTDDGLVVCADGFEWVTAALAKLGSKAAAEEITKLAPATDAPVVVAVGTGAEPSAHDLCRAIGAAVRSLSDVAQVAIAGSDDPTEVRAMALGAALGAYRFTTYRQPSGAAIEAISVHTSVPIADIELDAVRAEAAAVAFSKSLATTSPSELYPARFAEIAVERAESLGLTVRVWDEQTLAADGFGGILAVGQGSARLPRLVRVEWAPADAERHVALVGKGITFDSGGLSLKPANSMPNMKNDMSGAATVLATVCAAAEIGLPVKVTGWLCLAENMPSGTATRPGDVIRMHNGTTVEITNTDAEGRLVLGDGLDAASAEQPDILIDIATLTGAQVSALGGRIAGLMGTDAAVHAVQRAADAAGEALWPMPLPTHLKPLLKSSIADCVNAKIGTVVPGMLVAGVFLQQFIGKHTDGSGIEWAHLDIAGPADNTGSAWGYTGTGPTGYGVLTLLEVVRALGTK